MSVLVGLEGDVVKTLQAIKKGIALLDERRAALIASAAEERGEAAIASEAGSGPDSEVDEAEGASQPAHS